MNAESNPKLIHDGRLQCQGFNERRYLKYLTVYYSHLIELSVHGKLIEVFQ